jgi:single-strand DNA-binding protein
MRSINKVILIGNLTKDPVIREVAEGKKVASFTIATNREWGTGAEKKSSAEFHSLSAWGRLADVCEKFLKKGKLVYVEGYLKTRYKEISPEIRLSLTEIIVQDMIMLSKRETEEDFVSETSHNEYQEISEEIFSEEESF